MYKNMSILDLFWGRSPSSCLGLLIYPSYTRLRPGALALKACKGVETTRGFAARANLIQTKRAVSKDRYMSTLMYKQLKGAVSPRFSTT